jgi:hypothetical protein
MRHKVIYVYIKKLKIYINRSLADKKDIVFFYMEREEEKILKWRMNKLIRTFEPKEG